ncbi:hypothetical protein SAMN02799638_00142, partial [Arthrobacter sp. UNCCL28]
MSRGVWGIALSRPPGLGRSIYHIPPGWPVPLAATTKRLSPSMGKGVSSFRLKVVRRNNTTTTAPGFATPATLGDVEEGLVQARGRWKGVTLK